MYNVLMAMVANVVFDVILLLEVFFLSGGPTVVGESCCGVPAKHFFLSSVRVCILFCCFTYIWQSGINTYINIYIYENDVVTSYTGLIY